MSTTRARSARRAHELRDVCWPAATSRGFSSLRTSTNMDFVGAVIVAIVVLTVCALLLDTVASRVERRLPASRHVETR